MVITPPIKKLYPPLVKERGYPLPLLNIEEAGKSSEKTHKRQFNRHLSS